MKTPKYKINKVREHTFADVTYKVVWKNKPFEDKERGIKKHHQAETDCPMSDKPEIRIAPKSCKDDLLLLKVLVDESIHSFPETWGLDNDFVDTFSESVGEFLYKVGFRLEKAPQQE